MEFDFSQTGGQYNGQTVIPYAGQDCGYGQGQMYGQEQMYYQGQPYEQGKIYEQGFGGMQGYPQMQPIKYSKTQIIDAMRNYIQQCSGTAVSGEDKVEEFPDSLRHACAPCGVSFLQKCEFPVPEMGFAVPFYFCTACGKLFYAKDFM